MKNKITTESILLFINDASNAISSWCKNHFRLKIDTHCINLNIAVQILEASTNPRIRIGWLIFHIELFFNKQKCISDTESQWSIPLR